jgi:hypothetical protein
METPTDFPAPEEVFGCTVPRRYTPPLVAGPAGPCGCGCALTEQTSLGFAIDRWARITLKRPLDPWQRWLVIHAHELRPDGTLRFAHILVLVARQNGKTELLVILTLYWLYVSRIAMVFGTSTQLTYARESWLKACKLAKRIPQLRREIPYQGGIRKTNGQEELTVVPGGGAVDDDDACRYKVGANNEEGGRSLTVGRLILDELRQHKTYDAYEAAEPTTSAVDESQVWGLSNAGDDESIVLNDLHADALAFIARGEGSDDLMLAEWSAEDGADVRDPRVIAQANPNFGRRGKRSTMMNRAYRAHATGGARLNGFRTEYLCIRVRVLDPAIDPRAWQSALVDEGLDAVRDRTVMVYDVALSGLHATLYAAARMPSGKVRVDVVAEWEGPGCATSGIRQVQRLVRELKPKRFGWLPSGPAAVAAAGIADRTRREGRRGTWPPLGVVVEEIREEVPAVCMGFADAVEAGEIERTADPLLNAQVETTQWAPQGARRVFARAGDGNCDAVYAAAGAAHLARIMPAPLDDFRILLPRSSSRT